MDFTQRDINNLSYTSKDFESIYPELLDLVPKLTSKWTPNTSNESDPGVVLLKLLALMADKNDFNIDKNILEAFPASVTQVGNARNLYSQLGYNMKWYQSATADVSFTVGVNALQEVDEEGNLVGDKADESASVTLPKFQTMLTNDAGDIVYTLVEDVRLDQEHLTGSGHCIQGVVQSYKINDSEIITLDNLDSKNRLYFTESQIAENGIFIYDAASGENTAADWTRKEVLANQPSGSKVYSFGVLSNSNTCYIQFPTDIASLIGGGLKIKYLISDGAAGNVSMGGINQFYATTDLQVYSDLTSDTGRTIKTDESFIVRNAESGSGGADPESLDEAFTNYMHTVGTFDTLVSCRDYENAIYSLTDPETGHYLISNSRVTDRTNDLNYTTHAVLMDETGTTVRNLLPRKDGEVGLSAFDISLYLLHNSSDISSDALYNSTFTQATSNTYTSVMRQLEEAKSIQHEYANPLQQGQMFMVKNFCSLNGNLITYYKVTPAGASEIEARVKQALREAFNARKVQWGQAIDFDDIVTVIQNADSRIKTVALNEPTYTPYLLLADGDGDYRGGIPVGDDAYLKPLGSSNEKAIQIVAKMIEAGNAAYFNFNTDFNFNLGQTLTTPSVGSAELDPSDPSGQKKIQTITDSTGTYSQIRKIVTGVNTAEVNAQATTTEGYLIPENENIYLSVPALIDKISYSTYVMYRAVGFALEANQTYTLKGSEELQLAWKAQDEDGTEVPKAKTYKANTTIKVNFPLLAAPTEEDGNRFNKAVPEGGVNEQLFRTLSASQSIIIQDINYQQLNSNTSDTLSCLWITQRTTRSNDATKRNYLLLDVGETDYVLKNDEYFLYTGPTQDELYILGSGTRISRYKATNAQLQQQVVCSFPVDLSLTNLMNDGLRAVGSNGWYTYQPLVSGILSATEMQVVALGSGTTFYINKDGQKYSYQTNGATELKKLPDMSQVTDIDDQPCEWNENIILNISAGPDQPQKLNPYETVSIYTEEGNTTTISQLAGSSETKSTYLALSQPTTLAGSVVDLGAVVTTSGETEYIINGYAFQSSGIPNMVARGGLTTYRYGEQGKIEIPPFTFQGGKTYAFYVIPNLISSTARVTFDSKVKGLSYSIAGATGGSAELGIATSNRPYFCVVALSELATFAPIKTEGFGEVGGQVDSVSISAIYEIDGVSAQMQETFGGSVPEALVTALNTFLETTADESATAGISVFNPLYIPKDVDVVDTAFYGEHKGLLSAGALWSPNHFLNPFTLPQLNLAETQNTAEGYRIKVAASSRTNGGGGL